MEPPRENGTRKFHFWRQLIYGGITIEASGRAATEQEHSRWVNTVLSNVKRSLDGTYHAFAFCKYAHRYLAEVAWLFNRRFRLEALGPRLLVAAARGTAWNERRLRNVPVYAG